jgi:outer membrane murein-binding lipoprotein Lpp
MGKKSCVFTRLDIELKFIKGVLCFKKNSITFVQVLVKCASYLADYLVHIFIEAAIRRDLLNKGGLSPDEKAKFESKVSELSNQIEDYQYKVEALKTKNKKLEEEHKEITHLKVKVESLRNSRALFINQIKDIKKKEKEFKEKADDFERKRGNLVGQAGGIEAIKDRGNGPSVPPPIPRNKSSKKRKVGRRKSAKMPTPDANNMIRLI